MSEDEKKESSNDSKVSTEKKEEESNEDLQFYLITLEDNNGNFHQIKIFKNSDAEEIAFNFCKDNDLDYSFMKSIEKNIRKIIEQFDAPNKKIFFLDKSNSSITEVDEENLISENNFKSEKSSTNGRNFVSSKKTNYNIEIENKEKEFDDSNSQKKSIISKKNFSSKQDLINEEYKNIINKENKNFEENKKLQAHINININSKDKKHIKNITTLSSIQDNETNKNPDLQNSKNIKDNINSSLNIFKTKPVPINNEQNFIKKQNNIFNVINDSKNKIPKNKNSKNKGTANRTKTFSDNIKINNISNNIKSDTQNPNINKFYYNKNIKIIGENFNINKSINFPPKISELYKRAAKIMNKAVRKQKKIFTEKTELNTNSNIKYYDLPESKIEKSNIIDNNSIQNNYFNLIKIYKNKSEKFNTKISNTLSLNLSRNTQNSHVKNNSLTNKFSSIKNKKENAEMIIRRNKNIKLYEKIFASHKSYDWRNIILNKSKNHTSRNKKSNSKKLLYKKLTNTLSAKKNYFKNKTLNNPNYRNLNIGNKIYSPRLRLFPKNPDLVNNSENKNSLNSNNSDYFYKKLHNTNNIQQKKNIFNHRVINNITNHTINNNNTINYIINNSVSNSNDTPNDSSHTKSSTDTSKINNALMIEAMNKIFLYFDKDKDNIISLNNYKNLYKDILISLSLESKKILYNMFDSIIELNKNSSNNKNLTINKNDFVDKMMFIYNKCLSKLDKIKFLFVQKDLDKAIKESNKCIFPYNVKPLLVNNKFKKKIPYIKNSSSVFKYKTDSSQIARKKDNKFTSIYC